MQPEVAEALEIAKHGSLRGKTPGRSDVLNISVPAESFVVPADAVSAIGDGNTESGLAALEKMFPQVAEGRANGGVAGSKVPIVAAAGEFIVHPEHVKRVGGGDVKKGHKALETMVKTIRAKTIKKLKGLPSPAKG